jgi:N6-adenosine-specific RNA methylase IME4
MRCCSGARCDEVPGIHNTSQRGEICALGRPADAQVNFLATRKREHSREPDEIYSIIEACSYGLYLEMFARRSRCDWRSWGNEVDESPVSRRDRGEQLLVDLIYE